MPPARGTSVSQTLERLPPQAVETERALLGALLLDRDAILAVADQLRPEEFYEHRHGLIWTRIVELYQQRVPADLVLVSQALSAAGQLDMVGGLDYLVELATAAHSAVHANHYAEVIADRATRRRLIASGAEQVGLAYDESRPLEEVVSASETLLRQATQRRQAGYRSVAEVVAGTAERLDEIAFSGVGPADQERRGVPSGFRSVDAFAGPMAGGEVVYIAARPSVGKSAWMLRAAQQIAMAGVPVGLFSLEMSAESLVDRLLAMEALVNLRSLIDGALAEPQWQRVERSIARVAELPLFLDDSGGLTIEALRSRAVRLRAEQGIGALVVDYVQLVRGGQRRESRVVELGDISRGLKALARQLEIPIIVGCQINRSSEGREDKRPRLADLRESGDLEQDGDRVYGLYRPAMHDPAAPPTAAELIILKHRNGPTGTVGLAIKPEYTLWTDLAVG